MAARIVKRFQTPRHWTVAQKLAHFSTLNESGCRIWTGAIGRDGYGHMKWRGKVIGAHRMAWVSANGPIPAGVDVCHKCDVRPCIEPTHMFLGNASDNACDMVAKGRWGGPIGETHHKAKLTEADVRKIRSMGGSQYAIAAQFGVSQVLIGKIINRKLWKHV